MSTILVSLRQWDSSSSFKPQYNNENYNFEMKKQVQEAHKLARAELLDGKQKSKEWYDETIAPTKLVE